SETERRQNGKPGRQVAQRPVPGQCAAAVRRSRTGSAVIVGEGPFFKIRRAGRGDGRISGAASETQKREEGAGTLYQGCQHSRWLMQGAAHSESDLKMRAENDGIRTS